MLRRDVLVMFVLCCVAACDGDRIVPFGTEPEPETPETTEPETSGEFVPPESQSVNAERVLVEGAELSYGGRTVLAVMAEDFDEDGDRDALAVAAQVEDENVELTLIFGRHDDDSIIVTPLATQRIDACSNAELLTGELQAPDRKHRIASASFRCEHEGEVQEGTVQFVVGADSTPRFVERVALREGTASWSFSDIDGDGYGDLELTVEVAGQRVPMSWVNRAGGYTRHGEEPRATLENIAEGENAEAAITALCGAMASVAVGGQWGLDCPEDLTRSIAYQRALELANDGALLDALLALDGLSEDEQLAFFEQLELPEIRTTRIDRGFVDVPAMRHAGLSYAAVEPGNPARFVDHAQGVRFVGDLPSIDASPIPSPDGLTAVRSVLEARGAWQIEVVAAEGGAFSSRSMEQVVIAGTPARGWIVLGWAPQGFVLFDGKALHLLATSEEGAETPRAVSAAILPAPLRGARVHHTGQVWVAETPYGVLRGHGDDVALWRPEALVGQKILAVALSGDAQEIAVATESGLLLLRERGGSEPLLTPLPVEQTQETEAEPLHDEPHGEAPGAAAVPSEAPSPEASSPERSSETEVTAQPEPG